MGLRDIGATLPPGFRFYPSDEELICHYLYKKVANEEVFKGTLMEIDLHTCEPWQLPEVAKLNSSEWYFFSFRDRKYATGYRTNRATITGYWKATGKDRVVLDPRTRSVVGMRKTLVFYRNRAPNGIKTGWIMHEFRLENPHIPPKEDWVLCRVFHKAKEENSDKLSSHEDVFYETGTTATISPNWATSRTDQTFPCGNYHPQMNSLSQNPPCQTQNHSSNSTLPNFSLLNGNFLHLAQDSRIEVNPLDETINPKFEDEYGFLFDMSFEDSSLRDGEPSNPVDMKYNDDSSIEFL